MSEINKFYVHLSTQLFTTRDTSQFGVTTNSSNLNIKAFCVLCRTLKTTEMIQTSALTPRLSQLCIQLPYELCESLHVTGEGILSRTSRYWPAGHAVYLCDWSTTYWQKNTIRGASRMVQPEFVTDISQLHTWNGPDNALIAPIQP